MKNAFVADLKPGQQVNTSFLVQSKDRKLARNGSAYLDLELRDSTGSLKAKVWDCDRLNCAIEVDDVVQVAGAIEAYQGQRQITVREIRRISNGAVDLLDFLPRTRQDPEQMYAALVERVQALPAGPLQHLLLGVLTDPSIAAKYKLAPAATAMHHAFLGGLLEHVQSLAGLADLIANHYPWIDRSLLLAGIVLHDLGKIEELSFDRSFRYSTRGQLLGHITLGMELVREKIRDIPDFPCHLRDQIAHMILSHHGRLEFGSPKEPMFPEALALHALDELDSKLESMRAQYETEKDQDGDWTNKNLSLGRRLLKPANH
ncbi:MAG: 3'-5' exoribonuclease YhaM family protein [Terriglobia bacterium]